MDIASKTLGECRNLKATQFQRKSEGLSIFKSHRVSHSHCPVSSGVRMEAMRVTHDAISPQDIGHGQNYGQSGGALIFSKHLSFSGSLCNWCLPINTGFRLILTEPCELRVVIPILGVRTLRLRKLKYLIQDHTLLNGKVRIPTQIHLTLTILWTTWFL